MKMRLHYAILLLFVCMATSCSTESADDAIIVEAENNVALEQELLGIVNDHRISLGFNSLEFSTVAYTYANAHTDYMISKGSISHDNFSSRASKISQEADAEYVGENVARNYATANQAFAEWFASPSHRKTMEGEFTHTAVSVKIDSNGNFYFTQLFYR